MFAQLVMDMEDALEEGICIQTGRATEGYLKTLNITSSINRTQLKRELMDHFQEHGTQEQSDGKHVVDFFRRDAFMHSLLKTFPSLLRSFAVG